MVFVEEGAGPPRGFVAIQPGSPPTYLNPEEKAGLFVGFWVVYPGECILVNGIMTCSKGCDFEPLETTTPAPCYSYVMSFFSQPSITPLFLPPCIKVQRFDEKYYKIQIRLIIFN